uniref:Uncharacterized protein n=1 Tax=Odontella aurita TaxID=265563 RepID=A0A7S4I6H5_9STRA|mmetsp:Transcript_20625/g.59901  ORF Transcript_20625/g.59901 Transcript_20625/m.59901 type:complete len:107 (+) Transcript_20625:141-461(+)
MRPLGPSDASAMADLIHSPGVGWEQTSEDLRRAAELCAAGAENRVTALGFLGDEEDSGADGESKREKGRGEALLRMACLSTFDGIHRMINSDEGGAESIEGGQRWG